MIVAPNTIETVCTSNIGRSEPMRLLVQKFLNEHGIQDIYRAISSGTHVDVIKSGNFDSSKMITDMINFGLKRGDVYDSMDEKNLNFLMQSGKIEHLIPYFEIAVKKFGQEEYQYREEAIKTFGIAKVRDLKHNQGGIYQDQTVAWNDRKAVFTAGRKHHDFVVNAYADAGVNLSRMKPVIAVLPAYAHGNPNLEYENCFGKGKDNYFSLIERMLVDVPMAMNKFLRNELATGKHF